MKLKTVQTKILILFILSGLSYHLSAQVEFQETNLKTAQSQIATTQTPYLIYFSGIWCPSCQLMEETTFTDQKLGDQIQKNYLAFKVDVDSKEGKKWMEEYAVTCLPTTIFYSANGQLLERLEKPMTSTELLAMTSQSGFKNSSLIAKNTQNIEKKNSATNLNVSPQNTNSTDLAQHTAEGKNNTLNKNTVGSNNLNSAASNEQEYAYKGSSPAQSGSSKEDIVYGNNSKSTNHIGSSNSTFADQNESNSTTNSANSADLNSNSNSSISTAASNAALADQNKSNPIDDFTNSTGLNSNTNDANYRTEGNGNFATNTIANFSALIEELNGEINELKALRQASTDANINDNLASNNNAFNGSNSNGAMHIDNGNSSTFLSPSSDNLLAQISACKALLTDVESLDKLIGILENYQQLLIEMKATQIQLAQQAMPSEYKPSTTIKKTSNTNSKGTNKTDLFARNQQIIKHLKLG